MFGGQIRSLSPYRFFAKKPGEAASIAAPQKPKNSIFWHACLAMLLRIEN